MFQIIDDYQEELETRPEFISIELLLDYFIHEISSRNNFEFVQAVIRLFLKVWIHHCSFLCTFSGNIFTHFFFSIG
jgi:hypothetical protein